MTAPPGLARRLGTADAVVIGLGAMVGAGVFAAFAPAARAAGGRLLAALAIAATVAYCNATSSARLAARYPASGGTYVYGRERLGPFWGYLAGWSFVVGKTASCAAMALTFAAYAAPGRERPVAVAAVLALTALNWRGVHRSALATRIIVAVVLTVLTAVVIAGLTAPAAPPEPRGNFPAWGVLQAAGLLFFAFAGYARIATLGEEVKDPQRTIPRAIPLALAITLAVYTAVALAVLHALGPSQLAASTTPLADTAGGLSPLVRAGAATAALGSLLALILGVSRTTLAMARDRHLPAALDAIHPRSQVPHRAELAVGLLVALLAATVDLRDAIGFSSFGVLLYYAIANAAALTLPGRLIPLLGLAGCLVLAVTLPIASVLTGAAVITLGALIYRVRT
ncbi:APC family permease [Catenuloplanes japonicus]|uniref:APC family permease n=1 Tax=Catenuloplanes japonicus TaxID=33876 RepID=UPI00052796AA|nr:APC family permease [Catenuloplanes japonicus]